MQQFNMQPTCLCTVAAAREVRLALPHLAIAGVTPKDERTADHTKNSGRLKVAVLLRMGCKPVVLPVTGTKNATVSPEGKWMKPNGERYDALGATEYEWVIKRAIKRLQPPHAGVSGNTRASAVKVLLHDRDSSHTNSLVKESAAEMGLTIVTMPTHCPDLTPLDATFFGTVKREWRLGCYRKHLPWSERCDLFLKLLEEQDVDAHLNGWVKRLDACIAADGGHIRCSAGGALSPPAKRTRV
jgi:hypothetical protein